jgi:hypothetical protein
MTERRHAGAFRRRKAAFEGTGPQVNVAGCPGSASARGWTHVVDGGLTATPRRSPVCRFVGLGAGGARMALRLPLKAGTPVLHGVRPEPRPAGPSPEIARVRGTDRGGPRSQDGHRGTR